MSLNDQPPLNFLMVSQLMLRGSCIIFSPLVLFLKREMSNRNVDKKMIVSGHDLPFKDIQYIATTSSVPEILTV